MRNLNNQDVAATIFDNINYEVDDTSMKCSGSSITSN